MRIATQFNSTRKRQAGIASVIALVLLALVLSFIVANIATLSTLHNDVKRIEQRQIRRINPPVTNVSTNSPSGQPAK